MITDLDALFASVKHNPDDDTARLVYADAVQEAGDEELAALIRVGVLCDCDLGVYAPRSTPSEPDSLFVCQSCEGKRWARGCEHPGCRRKGDECYISPLVHEHPNGDEDRVDGYYCHEHAPAHGFCCCCGHFCAGTEPFDTIGLCESCEDEIREHDDEDGTELGEEYAEDEELEDEWPWEEMP